MKTLILILSILVVTSCGSDDDNQTAQSTPITFTEIGKGSLYGNGSEGISQSNLVITNESDWQNLIDQMNSYNNNVSNLFSETNIDFQSYIVIAVFLEVNGFLQYVEITNINEYDRNILVSKTQIDTALSTISQPFHIVKIPITEKPIEFE